MGRLNRMVLGIAPGAVSVRDRGFHVDDPRKRTRLEEIGSTFVEGYNAALDAGDAGGIARRLSSVAPEQTGFAYEGAAMGLALLDRLTPWKRDRWRSLLEGPGAPHAYMVHIGLGWAWARLRKRLAEPPPGLDPALGWLAIEGYGFHEGFFRWPLHVVERTRPARLSGYALRAFDQGLGRSLWFVEGACVERVSAGVAAFDEDRKNDLWSGVGLAATYAGGVDERALEDLAAAAGPERAAFAQGVCFAAKARVRAGNPNTYTEAACRAVCALDVSSAAAVCDTALEEVSQETSKNGSTRTTRPVYERWRENVQARF